MTKLSTLLFLVGISIIMSANLLEGVSKGTNGIGEKKENLSIATFAGGCFWCMQQAFEDVKGIVETKAGYTGGHKTNPTYEEVSGGGTGHRESVQVFFDPKQISYEDLLNLYWHNIDPEDGKGQFCDRGEEYTSAIFYHDGEQKELAEQSKDQLIKAGTVKSIETQILPASTFYEAEEYHQKYYKKNPYRYKFYRYVCGRDKRLKEIWGDSAGNPKE